MTMQTKPFCHARAFWKFAAIIAAASFLWIAQPVGASASAAPSSPAAAAPAAKKPHKSHKGKKGHHHK